MSDNPLAKLKTIEDFNLNNKSVFLRLDLNVPLKDGKITDETRIMAALPTLKYALEHGAKLVVASHLGRPKTEQDRAKYSLQPVAERLSDLLGVEVILVEEPNSDAPKALRGSLNSKKIVMLENLRFDKDETKNGSRLAEVIASYTDIYINDAFGASHRAHASIVGVPERVKQNGIGFLIKKEVEMLEKVRQASSHPYWAVLGGAKVSDKISVIENLIDKVDGLIIGGAMAYTFLAAQGKSVGKSLLEKDKVGLAKELLDRYVVRKKQFLIPLDHRVVSDLDNVDSLKVTADANIEDSMMGVDIGPKTEELYCRILSQAQLIFWNGPMGVFEKPEYAKGTFAVAEAIANNPHTTIVGGGDSAAAAAASGYADKFTHISTGGGASLEYLQGGVLPGLEILMHKKKRE